jgi:hypothetical protein
MSEWISVKDRLPANRTSVLVWCPERRNKYTAYWADGEWTHFAGFFSFVEEEVTHWMPLPEPPK